MEGRQKGEGAQSGGLELESWGWNLIPISIPDLGDRSLFVGQEIAFSPQRDANFDRIPTE